MNNMIKILIAAVALGTSSAYCVSSPASAHTLPNNPHWGGNGYANPHIWIKDTTGTNWPVYDNTTNWDRSSYLDLFYQSGSCGGNHCIAVYEYNENDGNAGYTGGVLQSMCSNNNPCGTSWTGHFADSAGQWGHPYVKLNNYYVTHGWTNTNGNYYSGMTASMRSATTCHEIGHAFGLAHHASYDPDTSCMNAGPDDFYNYVNNHAWDDLGDIYGHVTASNTWG